MCPTDRKLKENPLSLADDIESPLERKRKPKVQKRRTVDLTSLSQSQ